MGNLLQPAYSIHSIFETEVLLDLGKALVYAREHLFKSNDAIFVVDGFVDLANLALNRREALSELTICCVVLDGINNRVHLHCHEVVRAYNFFPQLLEESVLVLKDQGETLTKDVGFSI